MTIPAHSTKRISRFPSYSLVLIALFPLAACPILRAQQQPDLDALAAKATDKIHKSAKILVIDFAEAQGKPNELGVVLADQFAVSLGKNTRGLVVVDRGDYARATAEDLLRPEARAEEQSGRCYGQQLGADFVVEGTIDTSNGNLQIDIKVTQLSERKNVFDGTVSLPLTSDLRTDLSRPATTVPISSGRDQNVWTNPVSSLNRGDAATVQTSANRKGSPPACIYCPNATFSDAAVRAKVQGTVLLDVVIDTDGRPASISVERGIPCGLNSQAVEAVKQWKFKPAVDSDGNPVAVRQVAELTFHLY